MKTFDERTDDVLNRIHTGKKRKTQKRRLIAAAACVCLFALIAAVLFVPYSTTPPDVSMYAGSDYYELIQRLNVATYTPPRYKNNFEYLTAQLERAAEGLKYGATGGDVMYAPEMDANEALNDGFPGGTYVETTDNQVQGVIEGDLIKRSDQYIYYLRGTELAVYPIAGEDTVDLERFSISFDSDTYWIENTEMYLSQDCTTVTVFLSGFGDVIEKGEKSAFVCAVSLDVTDPLNIKEVNRQYITGSYLSSRKADGTFLLMSRYSVLKNEINFDDPTTFLPQIGVPENMELVDAENVIAPDVLTNLQYTIVTVLDEQELTVSDTAAFLSYSDEIYVSENNIFATRSYSQSAEKNISKTVTEISCLSYTDEKLENKGSIVLDGSVKNQYSMDEHEGILRVVTSTAVTTYEERIFDDYAYRMNLGTERNVNLYCVNLSDWTVAAKVEAFAPDGETAESVRFDGDTAYVCTAEVITLTDPVYFFDLSDLANITWKDTGTIDGYSSSLVNFGDYLLGIGYNENRILKIEIYQETENGVASLCSYELDAFFSEEYKSYFIDRESRLIGLGVFDYEQGERYLLLGFDGIQLKELVNTELSGDNAQKRAVLVDGWLYMFGNASAGTTFAVKKIW